MDRSSFAACLLCACAASGGADAWPTIAEAPNWIATLYVATDGSMSELLELVGPHGKCPRVDLVAVGMTSLFSELGWNSQNPVLLLAGSPDALASAQELLWTAGLARVEQPLIHRALALHLEPRPAPRGHRAAAEGRPEALLDSRYAGGWISLYFVAREREPDVWEALGELAIAREPTFAMFSVRTFDKDGRAGECGLLCILGEWDHLVEVHSILRGLQGSAGRPLFTPGYVFCREYLIPADGMLFDRSAARNARATADARVP